VSHFAKLRMAEAGGMPDDDEGAFDAFVVAERSQVSRSFLLLGPDAAGGVPVVFVVLFHL